MDYPGLNQQWVDNPCWNRYYFVCEKVLPLDCDGNGKCTCKPGYYGKNCENTCDCDANGSSGCDEKGKCNCKEGVVGNTCNECQANSFGFPNCQGKF